MLIFVLFRFVFVLLLVVLGLRWVGFFVGFVFALWGWYFGLRWVGFRIGILVWLLTGVLLIDLCVYCVFCLILFLFCDLFGNFGFGVFEGLV